MTGKESGAYELNHRGSIHRASDFSQLLSWVKEYRVSAGDTYREAGTEEWLPVMSRREFASILNPDNQWSVSMASGVFRAPDFETVVGWAREGRVTEDAVVEGPRTPPGGVKAAALPAMAQHLKELPGREQNAPWIRIDGRIYRSPDTDTVRSWIRESRVPVDSEFSLDGKNWEPVISCGLFDLEDWPDAAHGRVEEDYLPEMPASEEPSPPIEEAPPSGGPAGGEEEETLPESAGEEESTDGRDKEYRKVLLTVTTAENEITVESVSELKRLLRRRAIFSYDEISHPDNPDRTLSVGEYLEELRRAGKKKAFWIWGSAAAAVAAYCALELTGVIETVPWF